jgi:nucleotide-binding universal stress UspA family protein
MIKRILVPLDPSPYTESAVLTACHYAKANHAEMTGLVILDIPGIERSIGPVPLGASAYAEHIEKQKMKEAKARIHALLTAFKETCERQGVKHLESEYQGAPSASIVQASGWFDVVFMGLRTFYHFETRNDSGDTLDQVLDHSATPIYGVPAPFIKPFGRLSKIKALAAVDGSPPSTVSLKSFIGMIPPEKIHLKLVASNSDEGMARQVLADAEGYVRACGVGKIEKEWTPQNIIKAVDERYLSWADVIVVGAHSKKGLLDFMVGSLTKFVIKKAEKPVFIGQ